VFISDKNMADIYESLVQEQLKNLLPYEGSAPICVQLMNQDVHDK
jgi:hypothetical protein